MRIARLDLLRYGRFSDVVLELPAAERDFHVVFGPNEGGKTTARAAIADLLFGFEHTTAYGFRFEAPQLRVGALLQADGRSLVLRRRKGRTSTLLDESDKPLADAALAPFLEGRTRELFERLFSLDQATLVQGGQDVVQARNDLGRMLFQSAAGLGRLGEALAGLEQEADSLWAPRRSDKRAYWKAESVLQQADKTLKETTLRAPAYREAVQARDDALAAAEENDRQRRALRSEEHRLRRLQGSLPRLAERAQLLAQVAEMGEVIELPEDSAARLAEARRRKATAEERIRLYEGTEAARQGELEALTVDEAVLAAAPEIERLSDLRARYRPYAADIAKREGEIRAQRASLERMVGELGWPRGTDEQLAARLPSRLVTTRLQTLARDQGGIATTVDSAKKALEGQRALAAETEAELADLPEDEASDALGAALAAARRLGDADQRHADLGRMVQRARTEARKTIEALRPWHGSAEALAALVPPSADRLARLRTAIESTEAGWQRARDLAADKTRELNEARLRVAQIRRDGRPVSSEDLQQARATRDEVWQSIRHGLESGDVDAGRGGIAPFEAAQAQADELADRRFDRASESADLTRSLQEVERLQLALSAAETAVRDQDTARTAALEGLATIRQEIGLAEATIEDVEAWLRDRTTALDRVRLQDEAERALAHFEAELDRAIQALLVVLGGEAAGPRLERFAALLTQAADEVQGRQARAQRRALLLKQRERGQRDAAGLDAKFTQAVEAFATWRTAWQETCRAMGLDEASTVEQAVTALDLVRELKSTLDDIADIQSSRIDAMQRDLAVFATDVARLVAAVAPDLSEAVPAEAVDRLMPRLGAARQAAARRRTLEAELQEDRRQGQAAANDLAATLAALAPLLTQAGAADLDALGAAIDRSQTRRHLLEGVARLERGLLESGDGLTLAELQAEADDADRDRLVGRLLEIEETLERLSAERQAIGGRLQEAQARLATMQGSDAAAAAAEMRQQALAEMGGAVQRWSRLTVGIGLLRAAMEKYREAKQAPLLTRAQALFAALTLGEFAALRIDYGRADHPVLLAIRRTGEEVPLEGLSTGTADQLFLALRIAALEEYLAGAPALPFVVDDLFVNFDDERSTAGLRVLGELARRTQVLFFTHHAHLVRLAEQAVPDVRIARLA